MSLATSRSRRANAGQRMSNLINDEEDVEFYKNAYGGFEEEQEDNEFTVNEDEIEEDYVDSDFDIDENEENEQVNEENEDILEKKQKKKAYVEPKAPKSENADQPKKIKTIKVPKTVELDSSENKKLRNSTALKRKELEIRQQERAERKMTKNSSLKKSFTEGYRITQEELLKEATETEKINLASLDAYHKLELAKKKTKFVKTTIKGPTIRYHSTLMPSCSNENNLNEKQSRNFIIFSDEATLNENFKKIESTIPQHKYCIITGLPAKYFDPLTQCPYANLYAYKILKDIYQQKQNNKL